MVVGSWLTERERVCNCRDLMNDHMVVGSCGSAVFLSMREIVSLLLFSWFYSRADKKTPHEDECGPVRRQPDRVNN